MNIFAKIREAKADFSEKQNVKAAADLKALKEKRVREEGKAKLIKLKNKERDKITAARKVRLEEVKRKFGAPQMVKTSKALPKKDDKPKKAFGEGINPAFGIGKK